MNPWLVVLYVIIGFFVATGFHFIFEVDDKDLDPRYIGLIILWPLVVAVGLFGALIFFPKTLAEHLKKKL